MGLTRSARHKDIALRVMNHKMEELRSLGYASLPPGGSFSDSLLNALPEGSGSTTIATYNAETKKVTVSVGWREGLDPRYLELTTLITETGGL